MKQQENTKVRKKNQEIELNNKISISQIPQIPGKEDLKMALNMIELQAVHRKLGSNIINISKGFSCKRTNQYPRMHKKFKAYKEIL